MSEALRVNLVVVVAAAADVVVGVGGVYVDVAAVVDAVVLLDIGNVTKRIPLKAPL